MNLTEQIGNLHALKEAAMIDEKAGKTPKLSSKAIGIYENAYSRWNPKVRLLLGDESKVYTYMDNLKVDPMSINDKINF